MESEKILSAEDPARQMANAIPDRPAILFSGQGSQEKGMGRDLAESESEAMNYWKQAEKISGLPLREIFWDGDEAEMNDTAALQPALTATNFNLWRELEKRGKIYPAAAAGHSLGEFAALAAAGVLSPVSVLEITSLRGRLMAQADPKGVGAMAAIVRLGPDMVAEIVQEAGRESGELIIAANYNTPEQTVVSGTKNAVAIACEKARKLKGRGLELKVSGAFHSPMMVEANRELAPIIEKADWHDPRFPIYCNVDGNAAKDAENAKKGILSQMISPVYWMHLVRNIYLAGIRWWMEISPRAVLGKMIGPSLAGIAGQPDSLRVDVFNSLASVLDYSF